MFDFVIDCPAVLAKQISPFDQEIALEFRLFIRSDAEVAFNIGELNLGIKIFDADSGGPVLEKRAFERSCVFTPNAWQPIKLAVPAHPLQAGRRYVVEIDCVREGQYWFSERGHPSFKCELSLTRPDALPGAESPALQALGFLEETTALWRGAEFGVARTAGRPVAQTASVHRSVLSFTLRMKAEVLSLGAADFCRHCYRTVLDREPEPEVFDRIGHIESVKDKINYWRTFFDSEEFKARNSKFEAEIDRKLLASLGWPRSNTVLVYALRFEWTRFRDHKSFFDMLAGRVLENSFSDAEIDETFGGGDAQLRRFFDAVVNLAAEYAVGLDRIAMLETAVRQLAADAGRQPGAGRKEAEAGSAALTSGRRRAPSGQERRTGVEVADGDSFSNR